MFSLKNLAKTPPKKALAENFAKAFALCLPPDYELSLVLVDNKKAAELNSTHRGKSYSANILSFPLGNNVGEIFLNLDQTEHDPLFLFIHGALHLKGMTHGSTMEREEKRIWRLMNADASKHVTHGQTLNHRSRHRHIIDPSGRQRNRRGQ